MSRNGKWALLLPLYGRIIFDPATGQALVPRPPILFNLESGEQDCHPPPPTGTFAIASDGTVVVNNPTPSSGLGLWRQGQFSTLNLSGSVEFG